MQELKEPPVVMIATGGFSLVHREQVAAQSVGRRSTTQPKKLSDC